MPRPLILYNPRSAADYRRLPLALLSLGAVLEGCHDYTIVDGNLEPEPRALIARRLREAGGRGVVGMSVMPGRQLAEAMADSKALKASFPGATIVWGGAFPTEQPAACLSASYVDYVVRGPGEQTLLELLDALDGRVDPATVCGLVFRAGGVGADGLPVLHCAPPREPTHPQTLPPLPYHRVDVERYIVRHPLGKRLLSHHSSRGCPFRCNFCAVVPVFNGRWLPESAARTIATVRHLHEAHRIDALELHDDNFFASERRAVAFARGIRDLGIRWWAAGRIDTLLEYAEESWAALRDGGCARIFTGAETSSDDTLRRMNKGGTASAAKTLTFVARCRQYGIIPELSFVLGSPGDLDVDLPRDLAFIRRIKAINPETEINLYLYTPVPMPGLYDEAVASGFRFPRTLEEWASQSWGEFARRRSPHTPWVKDRHRQLIADFEAVLRARFPSPLDTWMHPLAARAGRWLAAPRWALGIYHAPLEVRALRWLGARLPRRRALPPPPGPGPAGCV